MQVLCGPLLRCVEPSHFTYLSWLIQEYPTRRYTYTEHTTNVWHGSVLLVVSNSCDRPPTLYLSPQHFLKDATHIEGVSIHTLEKAGRKRSFWRFALSVPLSDADQRVDYQIKLSEEDSRCCNASFCVPAKEESMRILFHSCNGFSTNVKLETYAGPALWRDVLRSDLISRPREVNRD